eukprot:scaffold157003_cov50-Cyclotella_meneghiniana.AAC.1
MKNSRVDAIDQRTRRNVMSDFITERFHPICSIHAIDQRTRRNVMSDFITERFHPICSIQTWIKST